MSRSKNRKIADLISGGTFDDGVVAASEVTGLATVATSGSFSDLSNQPTPFDPSTLATVATTGAYSALSGKPSLGTASTQATGAFATAAQGAKADAALPKAGGAVTGNVTFGDNDKAIFGAGSDLQIYPNGSHSYISDQGTGNLQIYANDLVLANGEGSQTFLYAQNGGPVYLSYANAAKIQTTSTGVDVTGTVNADALTGIGSIDATTKNAIEAAGVGGAVDLSGGVGSSGINLNSSGSNIPIGAVLLLSEDSYINYLGGQRKVNTALYGMSVFPSSPFYALQTFAGDGSSHIPVGKFITTGTYRILGGADYTSKSNLAQRIA